MEYSIKIFDLVAEEKTVILVDRSRFETWRLEDNISHRWAWNGTIEADGPAVGIEWKEQLSS